MQLTHIKLPAMDLPFDIEEFDACVGQSETLSSDRFDGESWEIFRCWKEQLTDRFGAGTPAPSIPSSQRAYDGDNWFEYCEPWLG